MLRASTACHSPKRSMLARVRGCSGQISGSFRLISLRIANASARLSCWSTLDGRCSVTRPKPRSAASSAVSNPLSANTAPGGTAWSRLAISESIMTLPTKWTRSREMLGRGTLGRVQRVADLVGEQAIDFLRHQAIEAAQSRFNVHDRNRLLHRYQAARQRRIHVPDHDHAARLRRVDDRLES